MKVNNKIGKIEIKSVPIVVRILVKKMYSKDVHFVRRTNLSS